MLKHKDLPAAKQRLINATNYDDLYAAVTDCVAIIFMDYTSKDRNKFEDNLDEMFRDYEERKRKGESE